MIIRATLLEALLKPVKLLSRAEALTRPCPIPAEAGIYAWYFKKIPSHVPVETCHTFHGLTLLYIGISPRQPTASGDKSGQNLKKRIRTHYRGNASASTLRTTLGCLLQDELGIHLQKRPGSERFTFGEGESVLSSWMAENAFVAWLVQEEPWKLEQELIRRIDLPLNLRGNELHPFHPILHALRQECKPGKPN